VARNQINDQSTDAERLAAADELRRANIELKQWNVSVREDPNTPRDIDPESGKDYGPYVTYGMMEKQALIIAAKYDYVDFGSPPPPPQQENAPLKIDIGGQDFYVAGLNTTVANEVFEGTALSNTAPSMPVPNEFLNTTDYNNWQNAGKPSDWVPGEGTPMLLPLSPPNVSNPGGDILSADLPRYDENPGGFNSSTGVFDSNTNDTNSTGVFDSNTNDTNSTGIGPDGLFVPGPPVRNNDAISFDEDPNSSPVNKNFGRLSTFNSNNLDDSGYDEIRLPGDNPQSGNIQSPTSPSLRSDEPVDLDPRNSAPYDSGYRNNGNSVDVLNSGNIRRSNDIGQIGSYEKNNPQIEQKPNVLHNYANWTYNLGLYMLTPNLHTSILENGAITNPGRELSHLIVKSGGTGTKGVLGEGKDYHIENLRFLSIISQNSSSTKASNNFNITFDIVEPYGVAFMSELIQYASRIGLPDHFEIPYLLEIKFSGYDSQGNPYTSIPGAPPKYIPVKIINMQFKINSGATIYTITAVPFAHSPLQDQHMSFVQENFSVTGNTFEELLKEFFDHLNKSEEAKSIQQNREKDQYDFAIFDSDLKDSQVGYNKDTARTVEAARRSLDEAAQLKEVVQIPAGSTIKSAIQKLAEATDFGAKFNTTGAAESEPGNQDRPVRILKVVPMIEELGKYNTSTKKYTKKYFFKIQTEKQYGYVVPGMPQGKPTQRGWQKQYDWIFTGQNKDILDFDAEYNLQYFITKTVFTDEHGKVNGVPSGKTTITDMPDDGLTRTQAGDQAYSPAVYTKTGSDSNSLVNTSRSYGHQLASDNMDNILNNPGADMITLRLNIIGDPDWIPQDNSVLPRGRTQAGDSLNVNNSIATDNHAVFVMIKFKTPRDYNSETGLMQMTTDQTFIQGLYRVISVESIFENGQFTQQLAMIRVQNQVSNDPTNIPNITKKEFVDETAQISAYMDIGASVDDSQIPNRPGPQ